MNDKDLQELSEKGNPDIFTPPWEIKDDTAIVRLQERQIRDIFFTSDEFKQAEKERIEAWKPKEHEAIDFARVYCPIYDKVRPQWLCEDEHGDRHEIMDTEENNAR